MKREVVQNLPEGRKKEQETIAVLFIPKQDLPLPRAEAETLLICKHWTSRSVELTGLQLDLGGHIASETVGAGLGVGGGVACPSQWHIRRAWRSAVS